MNRRVHGVVVSVSLIAAVLVVPSSAAECPDPPRHCDGFIDEIIPLGDSKLGAGLYKDGGGEQAQASMFVSPAGARFGAVSQTSGGGGTTSPPPMPDDDPVFHDGDKGGVVVYVESVGPNVTSIIFLFEEGPDGVDWDGGHNLSISNPANDTYYVLPFTVTDTAGSEITVNFTVQDNAGNSAAGTVSAVYEENQGVPFLAAMPVITGLLSLAFVLRRRQT